MKRRSKPIVAVVRQTPNGTLTLKGEHSTSLAECVERKWRERERERE
ncbi:MAG: hypothetical protein MJE68_30160 [Proteobacteria bacterium]|nr:hypothetical protein [Pseudomonadota bacterium]